MCDHHFNSKVMINKLGVEMMMPHNRKHHDLVEG